MLDWNPDLYLQFKKERTLPAKDLVSSNRISKSKKNFRRGVWFWVIVLMS